MSQPKPAKELSLEYNSVLTFGARLEYLKSDLDVDSDRVTMTEESLPAPVRSDKVKEQISSCFGLSDGQILALYDKTKFPSSKISIPIHDCSSNDFVPNRIGLADSELELTLVVSLISSTLRRTAATKNIPRQLFAVDIEDLRTRYILSDLCPLAREAVLFETNLLIENGYLASDTIDELLAEVRAIHMTHEYLEYFSAKYPILVRRIITRADRLDNAFAKFLRRLQSDFDSITSKLAFRPGPVIEVDFFQGDSHSGGQTVAIVTFQSGCRVVYKPRPVGPEAAFQKYLTWFNSVAPEFTLKTFWCLDRENYGWTEYIEHQELGRPHQTTLRQFCYRYGAIMALIDSLNGTDIHFENLIAAGDQPVVIDLETILQPVELSDHTSKGSSYVMEAEFYSRSILFTAMADPVFLSRSLNGSPLVGRVDVPDRVGGYELDERGWIQRSFHRPTPAQRHCPVHEGKPLSPLYEYECVLDGFEAASNVLLENIESLYSDILPTLFGSISLRVIFRYTSQYYKLIEALNSPYACESFLNQDEYLSKLWLLAITKPAMTRLIPSEMGSLESGDIPYFRVRSADTTVIDDQGHKYERCFARSGLEEAKRKILLWSRDRIRKERGVLEFSLRHKFREIDQPTKFTKEEEGAARRYKNPSSIFDALRRRIIHKETSVLLTDLVMGGDLRTRPAQPGSFFYNGWAGICFALLYEGKLRKDPALRQEAAELAKTQLGQLDLDMPVRIGICDGISGWLYTSSHLGWVLGNSYFLGIARRLMLEIHGRIFTDRHFDVFSGAAGAVLACNAYYKASGDRLALNVIEDLGNHLVDFSYQEAGGRVWQSSIPSSGPTTGFAHGVSGIAYGLLIASRRLNCPTLRKYAYEAFEFVHSCYHGRAGAFGETQADAIEDERLEVWCHGLPGIIHLVQEIANDFESHRVNNLLEQCYVRLNELIFYENESLCHGTLGNLDPFINLLTKRDAPAHLRSAAEKACNDVKADLDKAEFDPRCGNAYKHQSTGLFTGLSGIAYQWRRLTFPTQLPSVLTFSEPL